MDGIKVNKDSQGRVREVRYLTDDRDKTTRLEVSISWGLNGDWYITSVPEGENAMRAVRLCTSGGASSSVPGLTVLVAKIFRLIARAGGEPVEEELNEIPACLFCDARFVDLIKKKICRPCYDAVTEEVWKEEGES